MFVILKTMKTYTVKNYKGNLVESLKKFSDSHKGVKIVEAVEENDKLKIKTEESSEFDKNVKDFDSFISYLEQKQKDMLEMERKNGNSDFDSAAMKELIEKIKQLVDETSAKAYDAGYRDGMRH